MQHIYRASLLSQLPMDHFPPPPRRRKHKQSRTTDHVQPADHLKPTAQPSSNRGTATPFDCHAPASAAIPASSPHSSNTSSPHSLSASPHPNPSPPSPRRSLLPQFASSPLGLATRNANKMRFLPPRRDSVLPSTHSMPASADGAVARSHSLPPIAPSSSHSMQPGWHEADAREGMVGGSELAEGRSGHAMQHPNSNTRDNSKGECEAAAAAAAAAGAGACASPAFPANPACAPASLPTPTPAASSAQPHAALPGASHTPTPEKTPSHPVATSATQGAQPENGWPKPGYCNETVNDFQCVGVDEVFGGIDLDALEAEALQKSQHKKQRASVFEEPENEVFGGIDLDALEEEALQQSQRKKQWVAASEGMVKGREVVVEGVVGAGVEGKSSLSPQWCAW
ncbi:unnamed protein product [Closterium sp. Naga37s-1]|nr:unnamed protein product [Closterium sp. Naga37s-1]